jgi:AcrR family transcriptional regulator
MAAEIEPTAKARVPLTRERVFEAAVAYADEHGIEGLSMRKLGQELGVEAMSLYHHVKNKGEILDGMVDMVIAKVELTPGEDDWRSSLRTQILAARVSMKRHGWAPGVIETRKSMSLPMMRYMESVAAIFRDGGLSVDLLHHAMHALGSRVLGFSQELFDDSEAMDVDPNVQAVVMQQMVEEFPNISAIVAEIQHQDETIVGSGCDDDIEFEFALDILLEGIERIRVAGHQHHEHDGPLELV